MSSKAGTFYYWQQLCRGPCYTYSMSKPGENRLPHQGVIFLFCNKLKRPPLVCSNFVRTRYIILTDNTPLLFTARHTIYSHLIKIGSIKECIGNNSEYNYDVFARINDFQGDLIYGTKTSSSIFYRFSSTLF